MLFIFLLVMQVLQDLTYRKKPRNYSKYSIYAAMQDFDHQQ